MRVNISLPDNLVKTVDKAAQQSFQSRSAYIRSALITKLRYEGETAVPNAISNQDFQPAKDARTLKAINQTLNEIK
jgi:predicted transcriptional regulator